MKRILTSLTVAAAMFANSASAFDPDDLQKLLTTKECRECDLGDANLYGAILEGANLYHANMKGASMFGAYLQGSNLESSDLEGADLSAANLESADLKFTYMNGVTFCNTIMLDGSVIYSGC